MGLAVAPERFAAQLEWLARNRTICRWPSSPHAPGRPDAGNAVALTFDDAYACNCPSRRAVARAPWIPAPSSSRPADRARADVWWDDLERMVLGHSGRVLRVGDEDGSEQVAVVRTRGRRPALAPDAARGPPAAQFSLLWRSSAKGAGRLSAAMEELREQTGTRPSPPNSTPMTADECGRPARQVSRSVRTPSPTRRCRGFARARSSTHRRQRRRCEALSGATPTTLAYPYGDFDAESGAAWPGRRVRLRVYTEHAFLTHRRGPSRCRDASRRLDPGRWRGCSGGMTTRPNPTCRFLVIT